MTRDQERGLALLLCVGLLVGGVVLLWPRARAATTQWAVPIRVDHVVVVGPTVAEAKKIDLNGATAAELTELPGIGPVLADRIVAYRSLHGPFHSVDDLKNVKGIGSAAVENLRASATVEDRTTQPILP